MGPHQPMGFREPYTLQLLGAVLGGKLRVRTYAEKDSRASRRACSHSIRANSPVSWSTRLRSSELSVGRPNGCCGERTGRGPPGRWRRTDMVRHGGPPITAAIRPSRAARMSNDHNASLYKFGASERSMSNSNTTVPLDSSFSRGLWGLEPANKCTTQFLESCSAFLLLRFRCGSAALSASQRAHAPHLPV